MRRATGLYAAPGTGKSLLMQMLCTSTALGAPFLGLPVRRCRSMLIYCEDDEDEMHCRQEAINRLYGCTYDDLGDMICLPRLGDDNTLMTFEQGRGIRTLLFHQVLTEAKAFRAQLAVLDTLSDIFAGNEIDRNQARLFVQQCLAMMAREINGAVVACAHPSVTGISSGSGNSGSTAWPGAFRSHLYLETPKPEQGEEPDPADTDRRVLTRKKSNWAQAGETIEMRWRDGVFIADRPPGGIIGSIKRRTVERVFLDLVDATTRENQPVSSNNRAGNYAPRLFAKRPDRERFMVKDFEAAMQRLFVNGDIVNAPYGRKGDERTRIVRPAEKTE
jgi:RecA-family ATPase